MAKNVSSKKTNKANNRPNCLKVTKKAQKVNLQPITIDGVKVRLSAREIRAIKNAGTKKAKIEEAEVKDAA